MTYQPFLPEVAAGSDGGASRRGLPSPSPQAHPRGRRRASPTSTTRTRPRRSRRSRASRGEERYDIVVVTAGAVSRTFPIPGIADQAIGMKNIEEAIDDARPSAQQLRQGLEPPGRPRARPPPHLRRGRRRLRRHRDLRRAAQPGIQHWSAATRRSSSRTPTSTSSRRSAASCPRCRIQTSRLGDREPRPAAVRRYTSRRRSSRRVDGVVELSTGREDRLRHDHLDRGRHGEPDAARHRPPRRGARSPPACWPTCGSWMRTVRSSQDAWACRRRLRRARSDRPAAWAATPCRTPSTRVRQGKLMAKNLVGVAARRGLPSTTTTRTRAPCAGIGLYIGVYQSPGSLAIKGLIAWFMHRGYHGLAMPMWERKIRVIANWVLNFVFRRDMVGLEARSFPRAAFERSTRPGRARPDADSAPTCRYEAARWCRFGTRSGQVPRVKSNHTVGDFESPASANWATRACTRPYREGCRSSSDRRGFALGSNPGFSALASPRRRSSSRPAKYGVIFVARARAQRVRHARPRRQAPRSGSPRSRCGCVRCSMPCSHLPGYHGVLAYTLPWRRSGLPRTSRMWWSGARRSTAT